MCQEITAKVKKGGCLGCGEFGAAWVVSIDGKNFVEKEFLSPNRTMGSIAAEVRIYTICASEAIPSMVYCGYNDDKKWSLILEMLGGGTLQDHLETLRTQPAAQKIIALELARALEYLHSKKFSHGLPHEKCDARLFDFAHSRYVTK